MPIRSCVTISLVPEARGGPFVFWDDLEAGCRKARDFGFDAVEIFPPGPDAFDPGQLRGWLGDLGLNLAAVGTGAGWVLHRHSLTSPDPVQRAKARDFVRSIIDLAGPFGAPAIIGSMQGRWGEGQSKGQALERLSEALEDLGEHARRYDVPLLFEPLNRYETNLVNRIDQGKVLLESLKTRNIKLLADLFHMNIEETDLGEALRLGGKHIGHVHFVDSNRSAAGMGHLDYRPVTAALQTLRYDGYLSAEAFPLPDSETAARQTISSFRKFFS
jgi:sugar phosphate isomerase/epimerase